MIRVLRQRNFLLLWVGQFISMIGDWMLYLALPFYIYNLTGSPQATGLMFFIANLPRLIFSSLAGVFVDRWNRKWVMVISDLLRGLLLLLILFVRSPEWLWLIYLVALAQSIVGQFFFPAKSAAIPQMVTKNDLVAANSMNSLSDAVTRLLGAILGGVLMSALGFYAVVVIDAGTFLFSALLLAFIVLPFKANPDQHNFVLRDQISIIWKELLNGFAVVRRTPLLAASFAVFSAAILGDSMLIVILTPFVKETMHGDALLLGSIFTSLGIGGLIAGLLMIQFGSKIAPRKIIPWALLLLGGLVFLTVNFPEATIVLPLMVIAGMGAITWMIASQTLMQQETSDEYRGRVFGTLGTLTALMSLVGMAFAGLGGERLGEVNMMKFVGYFYLLASLLGFLFLRKPKQPARVETPRLEETID